MPAIDVSVIIVNYNSGPYTASLVECLQAEQVTRPDGSPGRLEIVVVENDSPDDQSEWLDPLEELGVRVIKSDTNLGYAGGCNLGTRNSHGRNLLYMNPDVFVVPGGVDALSRYLDRNPRVGQVGPRGWFDSYRYFFLPRIELPTLSIYLQEAWRTTSRKRAQKFSMRRLQNALRIWSAVKPQEEPVLAGYAFMMPGQLARSMGPFDETFPLYFEDSDLTRRVRQAGYACMLVPESEMVHLYNKSAGQFENESMEKCARSRQIYWRKHYGPVGAWLGERASRFIAKNALKSGAFRFSDPVDLGAVDSPPTFSLPANGRYVWELTPDPYFTLTVGRFDSDSEIQIPEGVWNHLDPLQFFVRALTLPDLRPLGAWTFHKTTGCSPVERYSEFLERIASNPQPGGMLE